MLGAIKIVFGVILLANSLIGILVLPWLPGFFATAEGINAIAMAFRMRRGETI